MAPARSSTRRGHGVHDDIQQPQDQPFNTANVNRELFIDPMLGTPLAVYIEKDVDDKATLVNLITAYGGTVATGYSGVTYILVDPHKPSGQNLYQQYAQKKTKLVLSAQWIHECIKADQLHTFQTNWAGCKVTGKEQVYHLPHSTRSHDVAPMPDQQIQSIHAQSIPVIPTVDQMSSFPYPVYPPMHEAPRGMPPAPPQTWNASVGIAPSQTHINPPALPQTASYRPSQPPQPPQPQQYRDHWDGYSHPQDGMAAQHPGYTHEYRYREEPTSWVQPQNAYFEPSYDPAFSQGTGYMDVPSPPSGDQHPTTSTSLAPPSTSLEPSSNAVAGPSTGIVEQPDKRGRKRTRAPAIPAIPAAALVVNRHPPARSPTPPTRVIKSTYGGNLFTADDVLYLKKYIDYCQDQGLVLSLREICERIAVKAPHHTFYSWRRYCNKHQIRLGGYTMNTERSESPGIDEDLVRTLEEEMELEMPGDGASSSHPRLNAIPGQPMNPAAVVAARPYNMAIPQIPPQSVDGQQGIPARRRSPTPPRALFRSTTGKGVAFTEEDVNFLVKYMEYRCSQGRLDMVAFWKDVATKAPHHSRASWMKFWRRHKHELNRTPTDEPLPAPPDKKMRYSREDDILLAKFFFSKPEGTLDKLFQAFGRLHPHHPWKGWQEHHRIHKAKIDHLIDLLNVGESLDSAMEE